VPTPDRLVWVIGAASTGRVGRLVHGIDEPAGSLVVRWSSGLRPSRPVVAALPDFWVHNPPARGFSAALRGR